MLPVNEQYQPYTACSLQHGAPEILDHQASRPPKAQSNQTYHLVCTPSGYLLGRDATIYQVHGKQVGLWTSG